MTQPVFENPVLDAGALPRLSDVAFTAISPRHAAAVRAGQALVSVPLIAVSAALAWALPPSFWSLAAGVLAGATALEWAAAGLLAGPASRAKGYAVRAHDLVWRTGLLRRRRVAVPFGRIQHVETQRGPVERWFGLASVRVYTAGAEAADVALVGLDAAIAERLHQLLLAQAGGQPGGLSGEPR
ncbi:hypothetical protein CCR85_07035 [Rhodothalassium salexigens]|uniref:PH domain-containing protein n=1 Tax=Rhodothalassium salexigens TaxID=1086 RepID=UPI0019125F65|nr:PH domain-containing protein [Rhodothalassium salexigens]MBK5911247.1 hypothetical protein [Rhodothalassium salexigens]MBK5920509.1 hypothetical protein [Rhodothalassium salexigens]